MMLWDKESSEVPLTLRGSFKILLIILISEGWVICLLCLVILPISCEFVKNIIKFKIHFWHKGVEKSEPTEQQKDAL